MTLPVGTPIRIVSENGSPKRMPRQDDDIGYSEFVPGGTPGVIRGVEGASPHAYYIVEVQGVDYDTVLSEEDLERVPGSEPHRVGGSPMGKLILRPSSAPSRAKELLELLRYGNDVEVDDLEVLDCILRGLTTLEEHCLSVHGTKGPLSVDMARRLRFERGFDILPKARHGA